MIEKIFSTPLYLNFAEDQILTGIQSEISSVIDNIKSKYVKDWGKTHKISSDDILEQYDLANLENFIEHNVYEYLDDLQYQGSREYKIRAWVSVFETNDYGHIHSHGAADISGVYYFQTNITDGELSFYHPVEQLELSPCFEQYDPIWKHVPMVGKLLMFPGYLKHGIFRNQTTDTRISISFNIFFMEERDRRIEETNVRFNEEDETNSIP